MSAAGAAADSPHQKGLVGDQVKSGHPLAADVGEGTGAVEKTPAKHLARHRVQATLHVDIIPSNGKYTHCVY